MLEQWVNLPKEDRFEKDGFTKPRCGPVTVEALFEKDGSPVKFQIRLRPDVKANADYTDDEMKGNGHFKLKTVTTGITDKTHELLSSTFNLRASGGDKYKIEAKDHHGNLVQAPVEIETRRLLYFQVIKMKGMTVTVATLTEHMTKEFWTEAKKYYIKLKEIPSKDDFDGLPNFDGVQIKQIPVMAKKAYNDSMDRFNFAVILVDQLGQSKVETHTLPGVTISAASPKVKIPVMGEGLWKDFDDPAAPEAVWFKSGEFVEDGTGKIAKLHDYNVTPVGSNPVREVEVDTSGLTDAMTGTITLQLKVIWIMATGVSLGENNTVCVATRSSWTQRVDTQMMSTLVHELGHKVGMVPGGDKGGLKKQPHYYFKPRQGPHCKNNSDTCVMYESIWNGRSNVFCAECERSIRRVDLDANSLPGFTPF